MEFTLQKSMLIMKRTLLQIFYLCTDMSVDIDLVSKIGQGSQNWSNSLYIFLKWYLSVMVMVRAVLSYRHFRHVPKAPNFWGRKILKFDTIYS